MCASSLAAAASPDFLVRDAQLDVAYPFVEPRAIRVGSDTFLVYQGPDYGAHVLGYDHTTGEWDGPHRVGENPLLDDDHGMPCVVEDSAGRLHVFHGAHRSPLLHARSTRPGDPSEWEALSVPTQDGSYPTVHVWPDGTMELMYRDGTDWGTRVSADDGETWGPFETLLAADIPAGEAWYADFQATDDGRLFCAFLLLDYDEYLIEGGYGRHDVCFAWRDTGGTWRNADGVALSPPLGHAEALAECLVADTGDDYVTQLVTRADDTGAPCVLFLTGSGAGPDSYAWRFARFAAGDWTTSEIATTDHATDCGALECLAGGVVHAYVVTGGSSGEGTGDWDTTDEGGELWRYVSDDRGRSWSADRKVSPDEQGTLYNMPHEVFGRTDDEAVLMFEEWESGQSIAATRLYLWGEDGLISREQQPSSERFAGPERIATALAVSKRAFPEGAAWVVLARSDGFADALSAAPLAQALGGPVLLTRTDALDARVLQEIDRFELAVSQTVQPGGYRDHVRVLIVGGESAIGPEVESSLAEAGYEVERIGGRDRYDTARLLASRLTAETGLPDTVVVASGERFPDALGAGPVAAWAGYPILLVREESVPDATARAYADAGSPPAVVGGGTAVVPEPVAAGFDVVLRAGGADRYATSAALSRWGRLEGLVSFRRIVTTGEDFPDALVASVLGARLRAPVLLVPSTGVPREVVADVTESPEAVLDLFVVGGEAAVSGGSMRALEDLVGMPPS